MSVYLQVVINNEQLHDFILQDILPTALFPTAFIIRSDYL